MTKTIAEPKQFRKNLEEWREEVWKLLSGARNTGAGMDAVLVYDVDGSYTADELVHLVGSIGATVPGEVIANAKVAVDRAADEKRKGEGAVATVIRVWLAPRESSDGD